MKQPTRRIGETTTREVTVRVCAKCRSAIAASLCTYGCAFDGLDPRPQGTIIVQVYRRQDTLLSEIVE